MICTSRHCYGEQPKTDELSGACGRYSGEEKYTESRDWKK